MDTHTPAPGLQDSRSGAAARTLITLEGVEKVYRLGKVDYRALRAVDLAIAAGEMVAVVGPSGSGKTTILNLITGIDRPTTGTVSVDAQRLGDMTEEQLASWRGAKRRHTGNLDSVTAGEMFDLLERLNAEGKTVLYVTHDRELAARAHRVITIRDGEIVDG